MKNTFVKVLSFVMALTMIMSSFVFVATAADAEHTHVYSETVVPATCISKGHTVYTCECGDYYLGKPTEKATECRAEDLKDVAASAPTCTEPAYVAHKECALCGKVYGKKAVVGSKPNGHDFELVITDPDCGVDASMIPVCKVCGYEDTDHSFIADENNSCHPCSLAGHDVKNYVYVITLAPTCTTAGKANYVCPVEGCTGGYFNITITERGHVEVVNRTEPDCLNDGSIVTTCTRCDYRDVEVLPALGHIYDLKADIAGIQNDLAQNDKCVVDNSIVDVLYREATCYQDGYMWVHCVREGCECDEYDDAVDSEHLKKIVLPKSEAHVPETIVVGGVEVVKYYYTIKNDTSTIYNQKNSVAEIIAWFEANVPGFTVCEDTVNGYTKCIYCGTLQVVAEQSHIAEGHKFESKAGNGADEKVKTATGGNKFIDTKGWDIIWDEYPCASYFDESGKNGVKNYAVRECKNCDYQDPAGSFYFTEEHINGYVCEDPTCTTTKQITLHNGTKRTVQDCVDCTHVGRRYICYVCDGVDEVDANGLRKVGFTSVNAHYNEHNWVVKTVDGVEKIALAATCNLPAKYVWVCTNPACKQTRNEYKPEEIRFWVEDNGEEGYQWGEVAHWGYDAFLDEDNHEPYDVATGKGVQYQAPKCNEDGFYKGFCTWCSTQVNEILEKGEAHHKYVVVPGLEAITPNCMETGRTATEKCDYCANVKGGDLLARDYNNHKAGCTLGAEPIYTRWATCTVAYADAYQYSLCKQVVFKNIGQVNPANHVKYAWTEVFDITKTYSTLKTVAAIDPTCIEEGLHSYTYCEECDYIVDVDTENCQYDDHRSLVNDAITCPENHGVCVNAHCTRANHSVLESYAEDITANKAIELVAYDELNDRFGSGKDITPAMVKKYYELNNKKADSATVFEIAPLGHNFWFDERTTKNDVIIASNILLVYLHETCTAPGNEWKIQCTRCEEIDPVNNGETILPHGTNDVTYIENSVAPTCTEDGVIAGRYCDECAIENDPHGQDCMVCRGHSDNSVVDALGHNTVIHKEIIGGIRFNVGVQEADCINDGYVFQKCTRCYSTDVDAWVCEGEDFTPALGADNHTYLTAPVAPTCTTEGYDEHNCVNCGYTYTDNVKPALGHKDENGNAIYFCCTGDKYDQYRGSKCAVCNTELHLVWDGLFQAVEDGLNNPFVEHNYKKVVINAGCETDGYWYEECLDCGNIRSAKNAAGEWEGIYTDIPATGHDLVDIVDEKCVAATPEQTGVCVWLCGNCGEEQEHIIYYTRDVEFDLTVVPYLNGKNSATLTFLNGGYIEVLLTVTTEELVFTSFKYQLGYNSDLLSYVGSEFVFDFGANTYVQDNGNNVTLGGYFLGDKTGTFDGLDVAVLKVTFKVAPGVAVIDSSVLYSADVEFDNATTETISTPVFNDIEDIEVALNGDINVDGRYTMEDVKLIKDIIGAGEYSDVADIDKNGAVELTDFALLAKFVTSNQTIADYYAMFGIDVIALADAYDFDDYNHDGVITNVDAKIFKDTFKTIAGADWENAVMAQTGDLTAILDLISDSLLYQ